MQWYGIKHKYDLFLLFSVKYLGSSPQKASSFTSSRKIFCATHLSRSTYYSRGLSGAKKNPFLVGFTVEVIAKYDSAAHIQSQEPNITSTEAKS